MLLLLDPSATAVKLVVGELVCHANGCLGALRPWGYARTRWLRLGLGPGETEAHKPAAVADAVALLTQRLPGRPAPPNL